MITDIEIKKLKPTGKEYQKADARGLVLVVRAKGSKFWRYEYRLDGKKFKYGYGSYPEIGLSDARKIHAVARCNGQLKQDTFLNSLPIKFPLKFQRGLVA